MKTYRILMMMFLLILVGRTSADNLVVENLTMSAGESKQISINLLNSEKKYAAFQFDLVLPTGITIAKNENGKFIASLNNDRIDDHTLSVSDMGNNTYRFLSFSITNAEYYGTSGALVYVTLQTDENISGGNKTATIQSQVFTEVSGGQHKWSDTTFTIEISGGGNPDNPVVSDDILSVETVSMSAGETKQIAIVLSNPTHKYTAFQFDLVLPDGISIAKNDKGKLIANLNEDRIDDHTLSVSETGAHTYRFLSFSLTNSEFYGTGGALVYVSLHASESISDGNKTATIQSQVFTELSGEQYKLNDITFSVQIQALVVPEIIAENKSRTYGEENPTFTYTTSAELNGVPSLSTTATKTSPVGEYEIVVSRGTVVGEYTAKNGVLTVTKAPLTISAGTYSKRQYEPMPEFTLTYTGFKNNETSAVLTKQVIVKCDATEDSAPGEYPITLSGAEAQNYEISYVAGTLTVSEPQSYTLTYLVDGEVYKTYSIKYRSAITPEPAPIKEGYTFSGWSDIPETMPAHDVTVTGTFTINKYKLTYKVDGEVYKSYDVEYGAKITPEAEPTKEGYTFSGWSEIPETMPAHDITVTGSFTINKYKLTYIVDGEVYKSYDIEYGTTITPEFAPTKEGYTFSGWSDIPATMPAHDVTVTGTFTRDGIVVDNVVFEETEDGVVLINGESLSGNVIIPATITANGQTYRVIAIGEGAFKGNAAITSVTISSGVVLIGASAFEGCTNLKEIIIGKDVTAIADKAFADIVPSANAARRADGVVLTVYCYAVNVPQTATNAFENTPIDKALLLVEDSSLSDYCNAEPWKRFGTIHGFNGGSGINAIWAEGGNAKIYTLDGKLLEKPQKGLNIVRMSNGTTKKIVVSRQ